MVNALLSIFAAIAFGRLALAVGTGPLANPDLLPFDSVITWTKVENREAAIRVGHALLVLADLAPPTRGESIRTWVSVAAAFFLKPADLDHVVSFAGFFVRESTDLLAGELLWVWAGREASGAADRIAGRDDTGIPRLGTWELFFAERFPSLHLLLLAALTSGVDTCTRVDEATDRKDLFARVAVTLKKTTRPRHTIGAVLDTVARLVVTAVAGTLLVLTVSSWAVARGIEVVREAATLVLALLAGGANILRSVSVRDLARALIPLVRVLVALALNRLTLLDPGLSPGSAETTVTLDVRYNPALVDRAAAIQTSVQIF